MPDLKKIGEAIGSEFPMNTPKKRNTMLAFLFSGVLMLMPGCGKQFQENKTIFTAFGNGEKFMADTEASIDTFAKAYMTDDETLGKSGAGTIIGAVALLGLGAFGYAYHRAKKYDL